MSFDDLSYLNLSEALYSPYNAKATYNGEIVGFIIVRKRHIGVDPNNVPQQSKEYAVTLANKNWFDLRCIRFNAEFRWTGNLENLFDYSIGILPDGYDIWSNIYWDGCTQYITRIGGFAKIPHDVCPNQNIRIYSVYHRKHE